MNILIVEDEALIAMDLVDIVECAGHAVVGPGHSATTGEQLARLEQIDFALLDINLGRGQTTERVAARLAERGIPFVFLSAYSPDAVKFTKNHQILSKPYTEQMILDCLVRAKCENET